MTVDELRQAYLEFFRQRRHKVFSSDSLIPVGDASLLFTGAGMNQFKPYFLGLKKDITRATSCQKCLRTADLDRVGKTDYHHTFFEMLGNFSFGDYFKEQAIDWGWEFVTKVLRLPESKLWVSVYEEDEEAFQIWKTKIKLPESKIVRMDAVDNFWPSNAKEDGPNGPCGPCSEIYVGEVPGKGVEIWNLVFTQFDRQSDKTLKNLPQKNIDTGMGLERTASVLQGVKSNFEIDTFRAIRARLKTLLDPGVSQTVSENAVMDHVRAVTFSIADGALPSNEGRGYVIRKLVRLACDHLEKAGSKSRGHLHEVVPMVVASYGHAYPEIARREKDIMAVVKNEETAYADVLKTRIPMWVQTLSRIDGSDAAKARSVTAAEAFTYYDTYGVPLDVLEAHAVERGLAFDRSLIAEHMDKQRARSRESSKIAGEIFAKSDWYHLTEGLAQTKFLGYEHLSASSKILALVKDGRRVSELAAGDEGVVICEASPFYAESGGQIGDQGVVRGGKGSALVQDTHAHEKIILHRVSVQEGVLKEQEVCELAVDSARRADIMKNHTATHLLHSALRRVLGEHVKQSGSLVAQDYLRFDFTHFKAVDSEALAKVESLVNDEVRKNTPLSKKEMTKEDAVQEGAIAFFGEKYGDRVRVVSVGDFSKELCGGTHLSSTGEIGLFKIASESSIQAGVRRIEAVTGRWAQKKMDDAANELQAIAREFKTETLSLADVIRRSAAAVKAAKDSLDKGILPKMQRRYEELFHQAPVVGCARLFDRVEPGANPDLFQKVYAHLKNLKEPFVVLWQCFKDEKVTFAVGCSDELAAKGFHSGRIIKEISAVVEGSGGGRPEYAVGGGKRHEKAQEAMALGKDLIAKNLAEMGKI